MENTRLFKKNWTDVSIKEYFDIKEILDDDIDILDKNIQLLSIVTNYSVDELESMPFYMLEKKLKHLDFLNNEIKNIKVPDIIDMNNKLYVINNNGCSFIKLYINKEINKLTITEYINFNELANDPKNIHKILSLFIRPVKIKKNIFGKNDIIYIDYNELDFIEFINNNINIVLANSLMVFFSQVLSRLINYIKISLATETRKMKVKMKWNNLMIKLGIRKPIDGVGLDALIELQKRLTEVGMMCMN